MLRQQRFTTIRTSRLCRKRLYVVKGEKKKMDCILSALIKIFTSFFYRGRCKSVSKNRLIDELILRTNL